MSEDLLKIVNLLKLRGCSNRTINNYLSSIKRFKKYYKDCDIEKFTESDILEYLKINFIDLGRCSVTINVNRAAIKYYYLVNFNKNFSSTLLPSCKVKSRFPKIFSKQEILLLLRNSKTLKLQLMICLGYGSGLRVSEVASLNIKNIDIKNRRLKIFGKGNKERYTTLPNFTLVILKSYYLRNKTKIIESGGFLFPTTHFDSKDSHIKDNTVADNFRTLLKTLNFPNYITFHTLRHSFATHYMENDGDIWKLKSLLGHSSINSTMVYLHMAEDFSKLTSPLDGILK